MDTESAVQVKDQKDKRCLPDEVLNLEKKLWGLIHSKGLLHSDVKELYTKACNIYEEFILCDLELEKLQEVEYSLWKLHYKHIDEFRKQLRGSSTGSENTKTGRRQNVGSPRSYSEGFRLFLSEATSFYQNLIIKIKIRHGLSADSFFSTKGGSYSLVVSAKVHKCRFLCHRLIVCLGDLARYKALHEKPDIRNCKWSVVVANYVKAAMLWPNGGNPQNQLALLATYIGDDFLALYHCIRSLAVEEPFPDAWGNLVLLFEKNKATSLPSDSSSEVCFDFSRPSARVREIKIQTSDASSKWKSFEGHEHPVHREATLSSVFVRMIRSFFTGTSWEDLQKISSCTVAELEVLLDLDDSNLKVSLESYRQLDPARVGPFKSLQLVSILIFTIQNLTQVTGQKESEVGKDAQQSGLTQLLLTVTFICMGRLVSRCSNSNPMHSSPLLPAILVFVEWLVSKVNEAGIFGTEDETSTKGLSYFFGCFVELLNQITTEVGQTQCVNYTALWEDFELQGFAPLAHAQAAIDFTSHWENSNDYENRKEFRSHRIIYAAKKIAGVSVSSQKWLLWDEQERQFCLADSRNFADKCEHEIASHLTDANTDDSHQSDESTGECKRFNLKVNRESSDILREAVLGEEEEEEVILFNPLTRHNSAPPLAGIVPDYLTPAEGVVEHFAPVDDCLRRVMSLQIGQNENPYSVSLNGPVSKDDKPFMAQTPVSDDSVAFSFSQTSMSAGPPSLSGWVFNAGTSNSESDKKLGTNPKPVLMPIQEIASMTIDLSTGTTTSYSNIADYTSPYSAPVPSAPLLPEDAFWFRGNSTNFTQSRTSDSVNRKDNFVSGSEGYSHWTATQNIPSFSSGLAGFVGGYPPLGAMTSSEWLRQYRENLNIRQADRMVAPLPIGLPATFRNLNSADASRSGLFDRFGTPVPSESTIYFERLPLTSGFPYPYAEVRPDNLYNCQRATPYQFADVQDPRGGQLQLLQHLKEKEWQLQRGPQQMGGPAHM